MNSEPGRRHQTGLGSTARLVFSSTGGPKEQDVPGSQPRLQRPLLCGQPQPPPQEADPPSPAAELSPALTHAGLASRQGLAAAALKLVGEVGGVGGRPVEDQRELGEGPCEQTAKGGGVRGGKASQQQRPRWPHLALKTGAKVRRGLASEGRSP